jgi:imidazolonepropionase-like amidohydrolase
MELMQAAGMKPLDLLCQATLGNRQALTARNRLGELAAGCLARFILTAHDPLHSVAALRQRRHIIYDGQVFDSETVSREGL